MLERRWSGSATGIELHGSVMALENDATAAAAAAAVRAKVLKFKREISRDPAIQERTETRKQTQ
jgi:hypothetical protein